jgi:uncharacterized protein (DUF111 family)
MWASMRRQTFKEQRSNLKNQAQVLMLAKLRKLRRKVVGNVDERLLRLIRSVFLFFYSEGRINKLWLWHM